MSDDLSKFNYSNTEMKQVGGKKEVRKIHIRKGYGYKTVSIYSKKKHLGTVKRPLTKDDVHNIRGRRFILGLFMDCDVCKQTARRRKDLGKKHSKTHKK